MPRQPVETVVRTDSTTALGMFHRTGLGKVRHIELQYLWIQDEAHRKKIAAHKVGTRDNPADMLTKGLERELLEEHVAFVNGHIRSKRDRSALKLNSMSVSDAWAKGGSRGGVITRIHLKPSEALFTPIKVARGPIDAKEFGSLRLTIGQFEDR